MMKSLFFKRNLQVVAISLGLLVAGLSASTLAEAAECKGLQKYKCTSASSCVWIDGYTTKSGSKVRSYCRAKNKKKASVVNKIVNGKTPKVSITKVSSKKTKLTKSGSKASSVKNTLTQKKPK
ncbi:hypothetical protein [uncultured Cohaesibacter sp.]|uniref:hypothetical protein n=1 Tax=uncultured Cohaesibacter sp. TaxID=1002546 RepID=UPI00292DE64C|nr:hypothetical protein [uncultured Cohaesibacter sp.]